MERSKYLMRNGLMSGAVGIALLVFTAEQQIMTPFFVVLAGLSLLSCVRDMTAADVLKDEEEEKKVKRYERAR